MLLQVRSTLIYSAANKKFHGSGIGPRIFLMFTLMFFLSNSWAQQDTISVASSATDTIPKKDSISKFNKFNAKMEKLFKVIPVPILSYSTEAGQIFGLAKFNLFDFKKNDTITKPSKLSEVVTFSTKGKINVSISNELLFNKNKYMILSFLNYRKEPEYFFGIGNDVSRENMEKIEYSRFRFNTTHLFMVAKNFYIGPPLDIAYYWDIKTDSNSYLIKNNVTGLDGGFTIGTGFSAGFDNRKNRYNPNQGAFALAILNWHPSFLGSKYNYARFDLDMRKYFNPWYKHVIAIQATTSFVTGDVPYYDLAMLGGDNKMRGYYLGAYRDNVSIDAQVEYRMPVWNIFGIVGWIGTGRVGDSYSDLSLDGFKLSYGGGIRIRVDSKHNTNLRVDWGFGPHGMNGFYINFAEAF